ncbi:MAG: hypothetical protein M0R33_14500 [Methylomonas sp.]|jgi:hypothetical protein|uniref:hypothetical protein n=1 Tax=Methylomonas sp. TaxID=418 RepID=UPI0025CC8FAB|nr:hypothetical protein [Methylomonas sp.]MCK9607649.1 hypothetical protein [Methylomonas sp.]
MYKPTNINQRVLCLVGRVRVYVGLQAAFSNSRLAFKTAYVILKQSCQFVAH